MKEPNFVYNTLNQKIFLNGNNFINLGIKSALSKEILLIITRFQDAIF